MKEFIRPRELKIQFRPWILEEISSREMARGSLGFFFCFHLIYESAACPNFSRILVNERKKCSQNGGWKTGEITEQGSDRSSMLIIQVKNPCCVYRVALANYAGQVLGWMASGDSQRKFPQVCIYGSLEYRSPVDDSKLGFPKNLCFDYNLLYVVVVSRVPGQPFVSPLLRI